MDKYFKVADKTLRFEDDGIEMHMSAWKNGTLLSRLLVTTAQFTKAMTQTQSLGQELTFEQWKAIR